MFTTERDRLRKHYADVWHKATNNQPLDALETQIAQVIKEHPEYHREITNVHISKEYLPEHGETNPFLHLGLHLAIREQVSTNRPAGIGKIYNELTLKMGDYLEAEHKMMECLAEAFWLAQKNNQEPDEISYLACLQKL